MISLTIYSKDHKRRPIHFGPLAFFRDRQADIPANWCSRCGCEIFETGRELCIACRKCKGENRQ